ncbi:unknown [Acidaminococcus sp. CAG:917]|nr:unknown [Acidaminococcus sp. CAG:917]
MTRSGILMLKTFDTVKNILFSARFDQSSGATNDVITPVQAKSRKIRADMAGLAKFLPMPPKSIFAITIANNAPTTGTYMGTTAGRFNPKIMPVTIADRSPTVCSFFLMRLNKNSNNTQKPTQTSVFKSG